MLTQWGAERDRRDRSRWHTQRGPLSITGSKFFNWHLSQGGGGAIDLVMQLGQMDYRAAVEWLEQRLGQHPGSGLARPEKVAVSPPACSPTSSSRDRQPHQALSTTVSAGGESRTNFQRVRDYLTEQRGLAASILEPLIEAGKVYADGRGNAVFLMVAGKAHRPIGAELRGTGPRIWRGLAPWHAEGRGVLLDRREWFRKDCSLRIGD